MTALLLLALVGGDYSVEKVEGAVIVTAPDGKEALRYQLAYLPKTRLSVPYACYIHPLRTPAGTIITEVAPGDHRHHRGIFLAFVETHGKKAADFWG